MESKKSYRVPLLYQVIVLTLFYGRCYAGDCPADGRTWVPFEQSCYHFVHGEENVAKSYTLQSAKDICLGFGLLTVKSAEVNNFIVKYSPHVWKDNVHVWLDMNFNMDDDSLVWHDNTRVTFVNWDSDAPSLARADVCAALNVTTGKWKHVSCVEERENGVVCEAAQKTEEQNSNHNPLLTALVVLSVLIIVGVSAVLWCVHQRHNFGSVFTAFEYHPPFRSPTADEAALVDSEETEDMA